MNKIIYKQLRHVLLFGYILFVATSCEDALAPRIDDRYDEEWLWATPTKAEGVLVNAYYPISNTFDHYGNDFLAAATDDALSTESNSEVSSLAGGKLGSTSLNPFNNVWGDAYAQFQNVHLFLENGLSQDIRYSLEDSAKDASFRTRLKGEAFFLRAWWGMELLRVFGGVTDEGEALGYPILKQSTHYTNSEMMKTLERDTYEACVLQILEDCDTAIAYLPLSYSGADVVLGDNSIGRASGKAAYALKSRVATFAASPAFQPEGQYAIDASAVNDKWVRAAKLSFEAISLGGLPGYSPLSTTMMYGAALAATPEEYIFRKHNKSNNTEKRNFPSYYLGAGRTNPSQNLVDAFYDATGYPIAHLSSTYDAQLPYANRDKRLYSTVLTNGVALEKGGRGLQVFEEQIFTGTDPVVRFGFEAPGYDHRNTQTGYYLRKWVSDTPDMLKLAAETKDDHMHVLLRVAEVWYNYAEASNEAVGPSAIVSGCDKSALDIMSEIRIKAIGITGTDDYIDEVDNDATSFRSLIQTERRLEFAFENFRYFDLRRWKMPLDESVRGMEVVKTIASDSTETIMYYGTNPLEDNSAYVVEERRFSSEKFYYTPIPHDEMVKMPNIKNNKGW